MTPPATQAPSGPVPSAFAASTRAKARKRGQLKGRVSSQTPSPSKRSPSRAQATKKKKRKHQEVEEDEEDAQSSRESTPRPSGSKDSTSVSGAADEAKSAAPYQLRREDVPKEATHVMAALLLHIRILWGLFSSDSVPHDPTQEALKSFARLFSTEASVYQQKTVTEPIISPTLVNITPVSALKSKSRIIAQYRKVEEHILDYMKTFIARYGLKSWCPDLRQTPYSLYNATHRIICIDTFKQGLVAGAYSVAFPRINTTYATNTDLLTKMYDHHVHHYLFGLYTKEIKEPGSVGSKGGLNMVYKNRDRLCKQRRLYIKKNKFPLRYLRLITTETTSDDERDPEGRKRDGQDIYWIKAKAGRSDNATLFIRTLDKRRLNDAKHDPSSRGKERLRLVPPDDMELKPSVLTRLGTGIPLDYYNPTFYNNLSPAVRAKVASCDIVLPHGNMDDLFTKSGEEELTDDTLYEKYRAAFSELYHYVDPDDLADDESSDDEGGDDDDEEEENFFDDDNADGGNEDQEMGEDRDSSMDLDGGVTGAEAGNSGDGSRAQKRRKLSPRNRDRD
ncbi:hypothetical protein CC2G_005293 [Coprinopsis cinerea AmutBmut pab1-1]|nr:hypothetical protein CC2G_005293 [Coprinopsis cinerea AmutBmut pab1-1]